MIEYTSSRSSTIDDERARDLFREAIEKKFVSESMRGAVQRGVNDAALTDIARR